MSIFITPVSRGKSKAESEPQSSQPDFGGSLQRTDGSHAASYRHASGEPETDFTGGSEDENAVQTSATKSSRRRKKEEHRSLRYQHLDVLVTLLHRCILEKEWERAEHTYALLLRCKGVDIRLCYEQGLDILDHMDPTGLRSAEFLSRLVIAYPPIKSRHGKHDFDRAETFVKLLVAHRIKYQQFRIAMQELDGWLLVPPYKDDLELWRAMAILCNALGKQASEDGNESEVRRFGKKHKTAMAKANGEDIVDEPPDD